MTLSGTARTSKTHTRAERVQVTARARSRLADSDYADAFRILTTTRHTAEQWARRLFESGPAGPRRIFALLAWQGVLGLRLAPPDAPGQIAGWAIVENQDEIIVLHAASRLMVARMVIEVSGSDARFTTLLHYERPAARLIWAVAGNLHRALAPQVLDRADRAFRCPRQDSNLRPIA